MKNTLERRNCGQAVPETLDGKVTHDSILDRFRECYEELYNSAGTEHAMNIIKQKLHTVIQENGQQSVKEVKKVTASLSKKPAAECFQARQMTLVFTQVMYSFMLLTCSLTNLLKFFNPILTMEQYPFRFSPVPSCLYSKEV